MTIISSLVPAILHWCQWVFLQAELNPKDFPVYYSYRILNEIFTALFLRENRIKFNTTFIYRIGKL